MESLVKTITVCFQKPSRNISWNMLSMSSAFIKTKTNKLDWATCFADILVDNDR